MIMIIPYILTTFLKRVAFPGGRKKDAYGLHRLMILMTGVPRR